MASEKFLLSVADYIIFVAMLAVSAGIGLFFQFTSKEKTNKEYLLAGKDMSILPVAFSLMATFMSATTLMGIPAEMYLYGINMAFMNIGFILGPIIMSYVFLPIYFANDISTVYEGGMKAVLWTDVFQAVLMYICLFAVIVQGCLLLGGLENVFEISYEGGRIFIPKFSFDLGAHYTLVNIFAQGMIITMSTYIGSQNQVQRLMTLRNLKRAIIATFINIPMIVGFHVLCCLCGLVLYAYFKDCDPMTSSNRPIHSADQLIPYFIAITLGHLPGVAGLCICGIFSASLSTVSSAINSLASVTTEDFIRPLFPKINVTSFHTKIISLVFGIICIALSFIIASLEHLVKMSVIVLGNLAGPNLAVFLLAACTTTANEWGVVLGIVTSVVITSCLSFIPEIKTDQFLPLSTNCTSLEFEQKNTSFVNELSSSQNSTNYIYTKVVPSNTTTIDEENTFHISYMWVSTIALIVCLVVSYVGSLIISLCSGKSEDVPNIYLSPVINRFIKKDLKIKTTERKVEHEVELQAQQDMQSRCWMEHCSCLVQKEEELILLTGNSNELFRQ